MRQGPSRGRQNVAGPQTCKAGGEEHEHQLERPQIGRVEDVHDRGHRQHDQTKPEREPRCSTGNSLVAILPPLSQNSTEANPPMAAERTKCSGLQVREHRRKPADVYPLIPDWSCVPSTRYVVRVPRPISTAYGIQFGMMMRDRDRVTAYETSMMDRAATQEMGLPLRHHHERQDRQRGVYPHAFDQDC